ncbi:MAG: hypothetical protein QM770_18575 [Tepidisphaeraceae bacterium]
MHPIIKPYKKRRRPLRYGPSEEPTTALTLLSATLTSFEGSNASVELVFDTTPANPLAGVSGAVPTQWTATIQGLAFQGWTIESVSFDRLSLYMGVTGDGAGENVINYAADPSDIGDESGRMLGAVEGLALG